MFSCKSLIPRSQKCSSSYYNHHTQWKYKLEKVRVVDEGSAIFKAAKPLDLLLHFITRLP